MVTLLRTFAKEGGSKVAHSAIYIRETDFARCRSTTTLLCGWQSRRVAIDDVFNDRTKRLGCSKTPAPAFPMVSSPLCGSRQQVKGARWEGTQCVQLCGAGACDSALLVHKGNKVRWVIAPLKRWQGRSTCPDRGTMEESAVARGATMPAPAKRAHAYPIECSI
jgi:hypothetical protein